jgi:hypothetical protein
MPAALGAGGWMAVSIETVMGTYQNPATAGTVWVPILSEDFQYREDKYYTPQIAAGVVIRRDVAQSYYHIEGTVRMEVDPTFFPYFMYATRHTVVKSGAGPYEYAATPNAAGSAGALSTKSLSVTMLRNNDTSAAFGYAGCVVGGYEFTVEDGVLICTLTMLGLSEESPGALGSPSWVAPNLLGAASHAVYVDASGTAPAFATQDNNFNGFTVNINHNPAAQNRLRPQRSASYVSYGETEATYNTELDFLNRTEYDNFVAATTRAIKFESVKPSGSTWAASTSGWRLIMYRTAYDSYPVGLEGMGDLVMARGVNGRILHQSGGNAYSMECKSPTNIT